MGKKAAFHTLGCKVNQYETESVIELFQNNGYQIVDFKNKADIYIVNTCTVTNFSDRKSRQIIRRAKLINRDSILVIMGCYSQIAPKEIEDINEVDIVIGTSKKNKVLEYIKEYEMKNKKLNYVSNIKEEKNYEDINIKTYKDNTRAYVKIQDGCNQFCSYCIIPYARGSIRSREFESIINEVEILSNDGFKEIVLTGIHIASFGKDTESSSIIELVNRIELIEGIKRIRFGSLEPRFVDDKFIEMVNKSNKICEHFHLSLQSGSDNVLKRMNRKYSTKEFLSIVVKLKKSIKNVALTTDIIVGFPGETDEEFRETTDFVKDVGFSKIHVFKYSPKKGTKAASFPNQIENITKEKRSKELINISNKLSLDFNKGFLNKNVEVLFERTNKEFENFMEGHTSNYIKVVANGDSFKKGIIRNVKVKEVINDYLKGSIV